MGLKTLKELKKTTIMVPDLESEQPCQSDLVPVEHIILKDIREEAIKWIKIYKSEDYQKDNFIFSNDLAPTEQGYIYEKMDKKSYLILKFWIMCFFNIKEEDLNEE